MNADPRPVSPVSAEVLSVAEQLRGLETLPAERRGAVLNRQLAVLLDHARSHSPFWRDRLPPLTDTLKFEDLPVLSRADLRDHGHALRTAEARGRIRVSRTSGSTGVPVEIVNNEPLFSILFAAQYLRHHAWHGFDANKDILSIIDTREGIQEAGWSHTLAELGWTGRRFRRNMVQHSPKELLGWLLDQTAPYLITTASMAQRLAELALAGSRPPRRLEAVLTFGEVVRAEHRDAVRRAFGARIVDSYSCEEAGWLAFQCPKHAHYHGLTGTTHVEIVDDDNRPVRAGEEGKVLVTALYNYAMPLIRYDIGDRAVVGDACDCGLTLPVIKEIVGRERSFIVLPDGSRRLAELTGEYWRTIAPVLEYRVVQYRDNVIEAFVRAGRPLAAGEVAALEAMLRRVLHPGLDVRVTQVDRIDWESRWKRIDIVRVDRLREERP